VRASRAPLLTHRLPVPAPLPQVPSIQQTAALALGRLANYSDDLAESVVSNDILPQLVYSLGEQNVRVLLDETERGGATRRPPHPARRGDWAPGPAHKGRARPRGAGRPARALAARCPSP
jgi:hypothetical protein